MSEGERNICRIIYYSTLLSIYGKRRTVQREDSVQLNNINQLNQRVSITTSTIYITVSKAQIRTDISVVILVDSIGKNNNIELLT